MMKFCSLYGTFGESEKELGKELTPYFAHSPTWLHTGYTFSNTLYNSSSLVAQKSQEMVLRFSLPECAYQNHRAQMI
jgi:hypothetical protein